MNRKRKVYLSVVHSKVPLKDEHGRLVPNKTQLMEQVFVSDVVKQNVLSMASIIIDIENMAFVKTRSEYLEVGKETVMKHYLEAYMPQIKKFYMSQYGIDLVETKTEAEAK